MNGDRILSGLLAAVMLALLSALLLPPVPQARAATLRPISTAVPAAAPGYAPPPTAADAAPAPDGFQNSTAFGVGAVGTFLVAFVVLVLRTVDEPGRKE